MELVACHLSKIGYLGTLLKPLPSYAPVKQRRWERGHREGFCARGRDFQRLKYTVPFFKRLPSKYIAHWIQLWMLLSFPPERDNASTAVPSFVLYCCDHRTRISLINHPRHVGRASFTGRFKGLFGP